MIGIILIKQAAHYHQHLLKTATAQLYIITQQYLVIIHVFNFPAMCHHIRVKFRMLEPVLYAYYKLTFYKFGASACVII
jgi:hypothetical protein